MTDLPVRRTARVLFLDPEGRTLLFEGRDPQNPTAGTWWFVPGGGVEDHETDEMAAVREIFEETGQRISGLGEPVATVRSTFSFMNRPIRQDSIYFVKETETFDVDRSGWSRGETESITDARWRSLNDLETTADVLWPENLVATLRSALRRRAVD